MLVEKNLKSKKLHEGTVTKVKDVAENLSIISFKSLNIDTIESGQFVSILCDNLTLRRPFSVYDFDKKTQTVSVIFKHKGKGTAYLSALKTNDEINFIGAMGNGFKIEDKKTLLIGAGVGFAPISYLKKSLQAKNIENLFVSAFMKKIEIPSITNFDRVVTNDGSAGLKGTILDYLDELVEEFKPEKICACGPHVVLKAIAKYGEKHEIDTELAMEKVMACSIGVCRGCVIQIRDKNGDVKNATICHDGPIFKGSEVVW